MKHIYELIIEDSLDNNGKLNVDLSIKNMNRYNSMLIKKALVYKKYAEMKPSLNKVGR